MTLQPYRDADDDPTPSIKVDEAIALRRKVQFWRRLASLLVGLVVLALLIAWQRSESLRDECGESLGLYAEQSAKQHLDGVPVELVLTLWQGFDAPPARRFPKHYKLFRSNWSKPVSSEPIPLAVCEHSHTTLFGGGRNVLFKTSSGLSVKWLSESEAQPLAEKAESSK